MKIRKFPLLKRKLRNFSWRIFNFLENNGNALFEKNGESHFLEDFLHSAGRIGKKIVVFDIGANIGGYTDVLLEKRGNLSLGLHLFEPTHSCFEILKNKFSSPEIKLNQFGVSDQNTRREIFYNHKGSSLASLYQRNLDSCNLSLNYKEEIQLQRLDEYIEVNEIDHIDLLKIDIEGHELVAFKGMGKYLDSNFIDFIQFEYGGANLDSHTSLMELFAIFEKNDFVLHKIMPHSLEPRKYASYMENFNYANYVAINKKYLDDRINV